VYEEADRTPSSSRWTVRSRCALSRLSNGGRYAHGRQRGQPHASIQVNIADFKGTRPSLLSDLDTGGALREEIDTVFLAEIAIIRGR
jgi:hypothetical protein